MNPARMREIGLDMQGDADPTIQAAGEFVLDLCAGIWAVSGDDVIEHAQKIAAAYAEDPDPAPGVES